MEIQVKSSEAVRVDINGIENCIELNPLDLEFPLKLDEAYSKLEHEASILKQAMLIIGKKQDVEGKGTLSRNMKERLLKIKEYNVKCGEIVDDLLGEGTVKKVFGDKNYLNMYNDLFEALEPAFKEIYGNPEALVDRIKTKYSTKDSDVL